MTSPELQYERLRLFLVARRKELGMLQRDVAKRAGFVQSMLSDLETGVVANPGLATVVRWAEAVDVELAITATLRFRFPLGSQPHEADHH